MNFRIADTFTDSLARLTGDEQKAVKTKAFDLQMNPASPGMKFHRVERTKDRNFWSVRVNADIRIIIHKTDASLLLCYVDHHDEAYQWAQRRKLERHPTTGAAQLVEVRETVKEIAVPRYVEVEQPAPSKPPLFGHVPEDELLGYGVPAEWLDDVRQADEDSLLALADHLPCEAGEALLALATGDMPQVTKPIGTDADPFEHPDAQQRFRVMSNVAELQRALEYPWDKWAVFLHPAQRELVERKYNGPARVAGSAGTGKTIVALHRAVFLARMNPKARVLLTTFSAPLANAMRARLEKLVGNEPDVRKRIDVHAIDEFGARLYTDAFGQPTMAGPEILKQIVKDASHEVGGHRFSHHFIWMEWLDVVDAWQLESWEAYRDVQRLGRKTRLSEQQRQVLWSICERVRKELDTRQLLTPARVFAQLAERFRGDVSFPYDHVVIDEAQDIGVPELRLLAAACTSRPDGLFFAGDLGQRIFQTPFSWKSLGVDIRGRSRTLRINYRTSHQIRLQADRLLAPELSDVDGNIEKRQGTVSVFNGPEPSVRICDDQEQEVAAVAKWLETLRSQGLRPDEIAIFVRAAPQMPRARQAATAAGLTTSELDERLAPQPGSLPIGTMHLAKGLEFRAVAVMACDDEVMPMQERIEAVADNADLEEVYNTERHLLYVACTRSRDHLLVTGVVPASEFLDDMHATEL